MNLVFFVYFQSKAQERVILAKVGRHPDYRRSDKHAFVCVCFMFTEFHYSCSFLVYSAAVFGMSRNALGSIA